MKRSHSYALAIFVFSALIACALLFTTDNPRYDLIFLDWKMILDGFVVTVIISLITLATSMVFGFMLFLAEKSKNNILHAFSVVFNEIVMGTPLLVMVFLAVYVLGDVIMIRDKLTLGVIALTLYMAPYLANAYKTAIAVVDDDQYVVMDLYHFSGFQKYRYIIFPQMIKPLLPSILNNLSSIIKGSALLKIVSVAEISYVITVISSKNWAVIEGYYVMWLLYLMITIPLSLLAKYLAKKVA
ncbi:MAG: ABC transporter permease subunit [Bacillota bacterium]